MDYGEIFHFAAKDYISFLQIPPVTLTPLHVAFTWILRPYSLSFSALTFGAMVPDLEPLLGWMAGVSVFCGWDFSCSQAPDRLILHSFVGAITTDVVLTMVFAKVVQLLRPARWGLQVFDNVRIISVNFALSAAIASITHVMVDWLHHPANPVFWPFMIDGSYYVDGLLLPYMDVHIASLLVAIVSGTLMLVIMKHAIHGKEYNLRSLLSNPQLVLSLIAKSSCDSTEIGQK